MALSLELTDIFVGRGFSEKGGFSNCFISFSSEKHVFITIGILFYLFLSGKYSCLLLSIDQFFHVVYFLLQSDLLWNVFSFYSYFWIKFCEIFIINDISISISISLKTFDILENKSQVFQRSDCTVTVYNDLYYNKLVI